jgi:hypothetical protein
MRDLRDRSCADHDLSFAFQNRLAELFDIVRAILIVGISVNNDVRAGTDRRVQSCDERSSETPIPDLTDDMMHSVRLGDLNSPVNAAIVHDENLDYVDARYVPREGIKGDGQRRFFIKARNLNNEFHCPILTNA